MNFSLPGSNERIKEEATYVMLVDFLHNCEGRKVLCVATTIAFWTVDTVYQAYYYLQLIIITVPLPTLYVA